MKLPAGVTLDHDATVPLAWVTNLPEGAIEPEKRIAAPLSG